MLTKDYKRTLAGQRRQTDQELRRRKRNWFEHIRVFKVATLCYLSMQVWSTGISSTGTIHTILQSQIV